MRHIERFRLIQTASIMVGAWLAATSAVAATVKGVVEDADGKKVENATVWLIPTADVVAMAKSPVEIKRDSPNDEPLEDNLAANGKRYLKAKSGTGKKAGKFAIPKVPNGKFFLYVEPADARYLPIPLPTSQRGQSHPGLDTLSRTC